MNVEAVKELEKELEGLLAQSSKFAEDAVEQRNHVLNASVRELVTMHSEQIRNLGLVSGVVAPFSLTLLQIQTIDVSIPTLLFGFLLLLANIILSQFLLGKELNGKNRLMVKALLEYASASTNKFTLTNTKQPSLDRTNASFDLLKNIDEFDKLLGISPYSTEPMAANARLRTYTRWTVGLFSFGCGLIVLSVFLNPFIDVLLFHTWAF
jgi:hypothetical protein